MKQQVFVDEKKRKAARDARREAKWAAQDAAVARAERIKAAEGFVVSEAVEWRLHEQTLTCLEVAIDALLEARKAAEKGTAR